MSRAPGFAGLRQAAALARGGTAVTFVDPALHAGGRLRTESFLTPFRFNVGPALVPRSLAAGERVLEPDPLLAVGAALLRRERFELVEAPTAVECVEASSLTAAQRSALLALSLLEGCDPTARGSGRALARAARRLPDLVAVAGGNGLVVARLVDEIVAAGGTVIEGLGESGEPRRRQRAASRLGLARLFLGLGRSPQPEPPAFATAVGWSDGQELIAALGRLRAGEPLPPLGFVLRNSHLDPQRPGDPLGSLVWQGVVRERDAPTRRDYVDSVLSALELDRRDVHFALLWWPSETGEYLDGGSGSRS